jgi:prophage regulatory protein
MPWRPTLERTEFTRLPDDALIRLCTLLAWGLIPFSASTLWRKVRQGAFPSPIRVSSQITAWRVGDVRAWLREPGQYSAVPQGPAHGRVK